MKRDVRYAEEEGKGKQQGETGENNESSRTVE